MVMTPSEILKKYNLSKTLCRIRILDTFIKSQKALSQHDIQQQILSGCDRSTIFRIINKFNELHILYKIDVANTQKYFFNSPSVFYNKKNRDLVFFHCSKCDKTVPLQDIFIPDYLVPDGFIKHYNNFVIEGLCDECR